MNIVAFRFEFQGPDNKRGPGKPLVNRKLPVRTKEEDQVYLGNSLRQIVQVYDRGDAPFFALQHYYQIAFRVITEQEEKATIRLSLKWYDADYSNGNDLFYDQENDLWYQQTEFDKNGKAISNKTVSSINTAGGYKVFAIKKQTNKLLSTLYVDVQTTETVSWDGYQYMIKRLFSIQDRLLNDASNSFVLDSKSGVKIGKQSLKRACQGDEWDLHLWGKLYPLIQQITKLSAESIKKSYRSEWNYSIRRFDSRVIKEYCKHGHIGKTKAVVYEADYDNYENRAIKVFIQRILTRWESKLANIYYENIDRGTIDERIEQDLIDEYGTTFLETLGIDKYIHLSEQSVMDFESNPFEDNKWYKFHYICQQDIGELKDKGIIVNPIYSDGYVFPLKEKIHLDIKFEYKRKTNEYTVSMGEDQSGEYISALMENKQNVFVVLKLITKNSSEAVFFLQMLCQLRKVIEENTFSEDNNIYIFAMGLQKRNNYTPQECYYFMLKSVQKYSISGKRPIANSLSLNNVGEYCQALKEIIISYPSYVTVDDDRYEIESYVRQRYTRYNNILSRIETIKRTEMAVREIHSLLESHWFRNISISERIRFPVAKTPRFSMSHYYSQIHDLINQYCILHPTLDDDFDERDFGIKEIHSIYEYWVFYELLDRLQNLGFHLKDNTEKRELSEHFRNFIDARGNAEGYSIPLVRTVSSDTAEKDDAIDRSSIEIVIGYNCTLQNTIIPEYDPDGKKIRGRYYTPDYYIRITHIDSDNQCSYHWYFMDAKFKDYKRDHKDTGIYLDKEIFEVAIEKYIYTMQLHGLIESYVKAQNLVDPKNWDVSIPNTIQGAYLITANIHETDEGSSNITDNDRLFCYRSLDLQIPRITNISPEICGLSQKYYYIKPEDARKALDFYNDSVLGGKPYHKYGAIMFSPGDEMERKGAGNRTLELQMRDELNTLLQLIFVYKETEDLKEMVDGGKSKKRPLNLHMCWDSSIDHSNGQFSSMCKYEKTVGGRWKFVFECGCGSQRFENHCHGNNCKHALIKYSDNNYHMRYREESQRSKWDYRCPNCGRNLSDYQQSACSEDFDLASDQTSNIYTNNEMHS